MDFCYHEKVRIAPSCVAADRIRGRIYTKNFDAVELKVVATVRQSCYDSDF